MSIEANFYFRVSHFYNPRDYQIMIQQLYNNIYNVCVNILNLYLIIIMTINSSNYKQVFFKWERALFISLIYSTGNYKYNKHLIQENLKPLFLKYCFLFFS